MAKKNKRKKSKTKRRKKLAVSNANSKTKHLSQNKMAPAPSLFQVLLELDIESERLLLYRASAGAFAVWTLLLIRHWIRA